MSKDSAARLKKRRLRVGATQEELAKRSLVALSKIKGFESGHGTLGQPDRLRISMALADFSICSGSWLNCFRLAHRLTEERLALLTGIDRLRIGMVERGSALLTREEETAVRSALLKHRREIAAKHIRAICPKYLRQRQLERLLGISQGYVCRLRSGNGNPSPALCILLGILAAHPTLIEAVEDMTFVDGRVFHS